MYTEFINWYFSTDKSSDDGGMGLSMIVTIAACGGALVLVAFFIALICLKRRRQRRVRLKYVYTSCQHVFT